MSQILNVGKSFGMPKECQKLQQQKIRMPKKNIQKLKQKIQNVKSAKISKIIEKIDANGRKKRGKNLNVSK